MIRSVAGFYLCLPILYRNTTSSGLHAAIFNEPMYICRQRITCWSSSTEKDIETFNWCQSHGVPTCYSAEIVPPTASYSVRKRSAIGYPFYLEVAREEMRDGYSTAIAILGAIRPVLASDNGSSVLEGIRQLSR